MSAPPLALGELRVADGRANPATIAAIASLTGLPPATVKRRLGKRNGNQLVARAFADRWPPRASILSGLGCAALTRDPELVAEVARLVGTSPETVLELVRDHPRKKVGTLLPSLSGALPLDRESLLRTSVADVGRLHAVGQVARVLGIADGRLRSRLRSAHGRALLGRAVADLLPEAPRRRTDATLLAGRYQVLGLLGTGGMGIAELAIDRGVSPPVTVVLKRAKPGTEQARALRREFEMGRGLAHPNIIKYVNLVKDGSSPPVLVSEHGGRSLHQIVTEGGPLSRDAMAQHCYGLASAVDYLAERGVHHLDISPKNIVVDAEGCARLIDLGSARNSTPTRDLTSTAMSFHPRFVAPEVRAGAANAQFADQYSLALVVLWATLGDDRFSALEERRDHGYRAFVDALARQPRAIVRALADSPRERYSSAMEMVEALASEGKGRGWLQRLTDIFGF